ncbi:MAG: type transport system ATP-binding protein [Pseudonocardiales bacterium]|nr:type transport system ATP-binding protein [Pseudonocardiales bacterium]
MALSSRHDGAAGIRLGGCLVIEATGLSKRYGPKVAVDDLSFVVRPGVVTGFLGPNGSGKSTTTVNPDPNLFGPWAGIGITALYALAALVAGALMLNRRDA